jgi:TonB-dependent receptor
MTKKNLLLGSVSALAMSVLIAPAFAQNENAVETVVVTGIRASLQSAQAIKKNSDQVVDSISSVDIGALPDRSVSEALQRVPGVTLTRASASNELTGMGGINTSIMVRGLSWVKSLVNGRDEFTAGSGRTLNFSDVSADLLAGVDVYKNPTAKMIEGGVGGVVDLRTRKPFDQDGQVIAISGDYTYGDLSDRATPSVNALYSDRWNTALGEVGAMFSVDWQDQRNRTAGVRLGDYKCWDQSSGNSNNYRASDSGYSACMDKEIDGTTGRVMGPSGWDYRQIDEHMQRLASNLVLQWRPNDQWEITLSGLNSYAHNKSAAHYVSVNISNDQIRSGTLVDGTWTGSQSSLNDFDTEAGSGHNRNSDISLTVKYNPTDALEITADVQFVESSSPYRHMGINTTAVSKPTYDIDVSSGEPKISYTSPANLSSRSNYYWSAAMDHIEYNVGHSGNARLDASYKFQGDGLLGLVKSVDAGFRTEQKYAVARSTGWNWGSLGQTWLGTGLAYLDGTYSTSTFAAADGVTYTSGSGTSAKVNSYAEYYSFGKILGNEVPNLWVANEELTSMNTVDSYKLLSSVEPAANGNAQDYKRWIGYASVVGCKGVDATCLAAYQNSQGSNSSGNRNSTTQEQTYAGYVQFVYGRDTFLGYDIPIDGNIGVRLVRTEDQIGSGKLVMPYLNRTCVVGTASTDYDGETVKNIASCADYEKAVQFLTGSTTASAAEISAAQGATIDRPAVTNGYTNILPSFNFIAHLSEQVQGRLAYSETIVRPSFSDMNASASLSFNFYDENHYQKGLFEHDPSGSGGNPYLKPMRARNYDASLEWYFSNTGSVTLSVFHKDLSDYFHSSTVTESFTHPISGQSMDFQYTTYVNTAKGKIEGFELGYTQFYDQLPGFLGGFGVQANYTKIYNSGGVNGAGDVGNVTSSANAQSKLPIEGMSNDNYNIALMYAKYGIDARLAWNWRSEYLSSTSDADTKLPVWVENYGQLDGSILYSFMDHYKIGVQVTNITGSDYYGDRGYEDYHPRCYWVEADRKFSVVFRSLF